jgi:hypothetical protein
MLFLGIWVPPYTVPLLCRWGWICKKLGVWFSLNDVKQSWLRLQTNTDCIPHPNRISNVMYKSKWFSTLLCCGRAGPPLHCSTFVLVQVGVDITDLGVWASYVVRYWLRLQIHPTSISYVNKVFSSLLCCLRAYGSNLTLFHFCGGGGWILRNLAYGWAWVMV